MKIDSGYWIRANKVRYTTNISPIYYLDIHANPVSLFPFVPSDKIKAYMYGTPGYTGITTAYHSGFFGEYNKKFVFAATGDYRDTWGHGVYLRNNEYKVIFESKVTNKKLDICSQECFDIEDNLNKHRIPTIIENELYLKKQEKRKLENKQ